MVKDFLRLLREGRVPKGGEILARVEPEYVRIVEACSRLEWLDATPVVQLADTSRAIVGAEAWREAHRATAGDLTERPLFRAFFTGMKSVFGATPGTYVKMFPSVLAQAHRNYGPIESETSSRDEAVLRFVRCPPEGLSRGLLDVFAGTMEGLVAASAKGVTAKVEYSSGATSAAIWVRWSA